MISVVALLAKAGHGKSTAARYLQETYGARVISLATPLKRTAQATMGFTDAQLFGTQEDKEAIDHRGARDARGQPLSARIFLQRLGTEGLRENFGHNLHLDALVDRMRNGFTETPNEEHVVYVVDDVRFPNEVVYLNELEEEHAWCVKLVCTDAPPSGDDSHASESGIDKVPPEEIEATVTSSRALGTADLIAKLEFALDTRLKPLKAALIESRAAMERKRLHAAEAA
jgi:dephospho-CoA kinase